MAQLSITKSYQDGLQPSEGDLDNIKNSIETFFNITQINDDNLQDGTITPTQLASTITDNSTLEQSSGVMRIKDNGITTAKINTAAVTQAKLASRTVTIDGTDPGAGGVSISASCGDFALGNSELDITNLSCTLTTLGRPVLIGLIAASSTDAAEIVKELTIGASPVDFTADFTFKILRGTDEIYSVLLDTRLTNENFMAAASSNSFSFTPAILYGDNPAAGTYTYKMRGSSSFSTGGGFSSEGSIRNYKLFVMEL